jgi:7-cyano-7-deazaguanine synthase in queuosine biosynthesis
MGDGALFTCNGATVVSGDWAQSYALDWRDPDGPLNADVDEVYHRLKFSAPARLRDLLEIACYAYAADALVSRGGLTGENAGAAWRRNLHLAVGVRDPDFWRSDCIHGLLEDALGFVSEDDWSFSFAPIARTDPAVPAQLPFDARGDAPAPAGSFSAAALFSGGLDSLAGAITLLSNGERLVLVSHQSSTVTAGAQERLAAALETAFGREKVVRVPFMLNLKTGVTVEESHRARSFLFAALGAVVARSFGLDGLHLHENGVVSFNLPIAGSVVGARATRTTHPQTLSLMQRLLTAAIGRSFNLHNPFLFKTKTDVVSDIAAHGLAPLIALTRSCARVRSASTMHPHCGACTQCIDRRFAALAAGKSDVDPNPLYAISIFDGERDKPEERAVAVSWVKTAIGFADIGSKEFLAKFPQIHRATDFLDLPRAPAAQRIIDLHRRHGRTVRDVAAGVIQERAHDLVDGSLPETCLLRLAFGAKLLDVSPPAQAQSAAASASPPSLRLHLALVSSGTRDPVVDVERCGRVTGKGARFLMLLTEAHKASLDEGRRAENFQFVPYPECERRLGYASNEALRRLVSRLRRRLEKAARSTGLELDLNAVIESSPRKGLRLNPGVIHLVAHGEMPDS